MTRAKGPAWDHSRTLREQRDWPEHAAFTDCVADSGFIVLGAPLSGGQRFLMVCDAEDERAVRARFADGPWVPPGLLEIETVEPWTILLGNAQRSR